MVGPKDEGDQQPRTRASGANSSQGSGPAREVDPPVPSELANAKAPSAGTADRAEPGLDLVPSIVWKGHRVRVVFNTLHFRPERETFHEFLRNVVLWTFGEDWWKHQIKMRESDRHVVVRWKYAFAHLTQQGPGVPVSIGDRKVLSAEAPRPIWALLTLGYDLFCLQARNALPAFLVDRLRKNRSFQGARYEVAAAAVMTRAGFEVRFFDGEGRLIRKARRQKPIGFPFFLFVDLNLPPSPGVSPDQKPWVLDLREAIRQVDSSPQEAVSPFNCIFATNFALHFDLPEDRGLHGEWGYYVPSRPETPLPDNQIIMRILDILGGYARIPIEV